MNDEDKEMRMTKLLQRGLPQADGARSRAGVVFGVPAFGVPAFEVLVFGAVVVWGLLAGLPAWPLDIARGDVVPGSVESERSAAAAKVAASGKMAGRTAGAALGR